ncbi:MAG: class I SAM-dependent methyltransferase [Polyangiaceae bacterium]|nr:class I SAM-dependent methyltransferase [Polyangiaceae bacterium]
MTEGRPKNLTQPTCPVCGAEGLSWRQEHSSPDRSTTYSLHGCDRCGVEHWRPLEHPGAEFYQNEQVMIYRALHEAGDRNDPRFAKFFEEFPSVRGMRALDIGCSNGEFLAKLGAAGAEVWGIDIDTKALEIARSRGLRNIFALTASEFVDKAIRDELRFDLITAFDVVEHLTDPIGVLRQLSTILAPGGKFVGTVPNRRRLLVNQMPIDFPPHHFFRFDTASLEAALTKGGLLPVRVQAFQYNYSAMAALDLGQKSARRWIAHRQHAVPDDSTAAPPPSLRGRTSSLRRAKQALVRAYAMISTPVAYALEVPRQRGFKLYFAAEKA